MQREEKKVENCVSFISNRIASQSCIDLLTDIQKIVRAYQFSLYLFHKSSY